MLVHGVKQPLTMTICSKGLLSGVWLSRKHIRYVSRARDNGAARRQEWLLVGAPETGHWPSAHANPTRQRGVLPFVSSHTVASHDTALLSQDKQKLV